MHLSSKLRLIRPMWSMIALKIDTFTKSFLVLYIEPGREVYKKAFR